MTSTRFNAKFLLKHFHKQLKLVSVDNFECKPTYFLTSGKFFTTIFLLLDKEILFTRWNFFQERKEKEKKSWNFPKQCKSFEMMEFI